jgi:hypothetical protein
MNARIVRNIKNDCYKRWPKSAQRLRSDPWADAGFRRPWIKAVEAQGWYREREPWLLASNLPEDQWIPPKVMAIYNSACR